METRWEKNMLLTWLSPCDVALSFKDTKVDGEAGKYGPCRPTDCRSAPCDSRRYAYILQGSHIL